MLYDAKNKQTDKPQKPLKLGKDLWLKLYDVLDLLQNNPTEVVLGEVGRYVGEKQLPLC